MGGALQHHILHAAFAAELRFGFRSPVGVHHQHIGFYNVERRHKIKYAASLVDIGLFHIADGLDHKQAFLLGIQRLVAFVVKDGLV